MDRAKLISDLLEALDSQARYCDPCEYGLPVRSDEDGPKLVAEVEKFLSLIERKRADDDEPFDRYNCPPWYTPEVEEQFSAAMEAFDADPLSVLTTWGRTRQLLEFLGIPLPQ